MKSVNFEDITLPVILERTASQIPEGTALVFMGNRIDYRRFNLMVNQVANALMDMGIGPEDKVAILLPNIPQMAVAVYATWRIGAVAVMNNPLYTDRELAHQLNDSGATILFCLDLLVPRMIRLKPKTSVKRIIVTHIRDHLGWFMKQIFPVVARGKHKHIKPADRVEEWSALLKTYPSSPVEHRIRMDDIASLQYTGGTTGVSKGVILTHGNLTKNAQQAKMLFETSDVGNVVLGSLPIFHAFGAFVMNLSILCGYTLVLIPRPTPEVLMKSIAANSVTIFPAVPTMFVGMLNHPKLSKFDLSSLKVCVSGAAPCPVGVIQQFEKMTDAQIVEGFGISEASPVTHINPIGGRNKAGSIGIPMPGTETKIVSLEDGKTVLGLNEPGELCIKGPQVAQGYYNMPQDTAETFVDGWLYTGDIATLDEEGYTFIVDRKKDMILAGGYNIYPREIDEILFEHPDILEACSKGVRDSYRGETVRAFVVPVSGARLTEDEVIAYCREKMAAYKVPTSIMFMDELPKSAVGKILRKDLPE
jgi:long-chain acyl-CoA synthetase